MKGGEIYPIYMRSFGGLTPYIRLESSTGQQLSVEKGANAHITFVPQADGDYRLVASTAEKEAVGRFSVQVSMQQQFLGFGGFGRKGFGFPVQMPVQNPGGGGGVERTTPQVNLSDLTELANRQRAVRIRAFKNLAGNISNDLAYRHAIRMANYLLVTEWDDAEL